MAALFTDDFNRADGAPGNDWTVASGTVDVSGNRLRFHTNGAIITRQVPAAAQTDFLINLTIHAGSAYSNSYPLSIYFRSDLSGGTSYKYTLYPGAAGDANVSLLEWHTPYNSGLGQAFQFALQSGTHTFSVQCVGTIISALVDGVTVHSVSDPNHADGLYVRIQGMGIDKWYLDDFSIYDGENSAMSVFPSSVRPSSVGNVLSLFGQGTAWTPGTPGDPEFTSSNAGITAQTITTVDKATLTYNAPSIPGMVVLNDPNYGRSCLLSVTNSAQPPGVNPDDPFGVYAWLNAAIQTIMAELWRNLLPAEAETPGDHFNRLLELAERQPVAASIVAMFMALDPDHLGMAEGSPVLVAIQEAAEGAQSGIAETLAELYLLDGYPTRHTIQDVLDAIGEGGGGSAEVLAAIAAVSSLVTDVLTETYIIDGYPTRHTIQDVLDAIGLLNVPDMTQLSEDVAAILEKVDAFDGDGSTNLPAVLAETEAAHADAGTAAVQSSAAAISAALAVVSIGLTEGVVLAALTASVVEINAATAGEVAVLTAEIQGVGITVNANIDGVALQVAEVQEDVAAIDGRLDAIEATLARIEEQGRRYYQESDVTAMNTYFVGTPSKVPGPMNGLFLTVTANRSGTSYWTVDAHTNLRWSGFVAFVGEDGWMDERQPVAFTKQVYMPKNMAVAAYCVVWIPAGTQVTIQPWFWTPA